MRLFPFTRPRTSLYFSTDTVCVGHLRHGLGGPTLGNYREHSLPPGSIRLSPIEPNVASSEHLLSALHTTIPHTRRPHSVAVCLPDPCARTAVFEFASLPKNKKDQQALVEWRLQKELNLLPKSRRVSYQRFGARPSWFSLTHSPSTPIRFLVVAFQNDIIEQYESLCVESGIIPVSINVAGLAVFNLCRPIIEATLRTQVRDISFLPDTVIFLYVGDWGFSLIVWKEGLPCFVRVKPLKRLSTTTGLPSQPLISETPSGISSQSGASDKTIHREPDGFDSPGNREPTSLLAQEVLGSLQFFFETATPPERRAPVYPLFLVGGPQPEITLPRIAETIEGAFPLHEKTDVPQVKAFPVFPRNPAVKAKTLPARGDWTGTMLATLAGGHFPS